jgi:hypothetical protein
MSTEDDREKRREESPEWHRARAKSLRKNGFTKMAKHHEQLARAIERIERQRAEHNADRVPPLSRAAQKRPRMSGAESGVNVERPHMRDDRQTEG